MNYCSQLAQAMNLIASKPKSIFVGQGVGVPSTIQTDTLRGVPAEQRIEFPVAEDLQLGFCIGLALEGYLPVCVYPRLNFLLIAANQLVNHLAKIPQYSCGPNSCLGPGYYPKVIIRVVKPATEPFDPGYQHDGGDEIVDGLSWMCGPHVRFARAYEAGEVMPAYRGALESTLSWVIVEDGAKYDAIPSGVMG